MNPAYIYTGMQIIKGLQGLVADAQAGELTDAEFMARWREIADRNVDSDEMLEDAIARFRERH